jgi:hypothetical protein
VRELPFADQYPAVKIFLSCSSSEKSCWWVVSTMLGACPVFKNAEATKVGVIRIFKKIKRIFLQISPEECDHPVIGVLCKGLVDEAAVRNHETMRFSLVDPELEVLVSGVKLH